VSWRAVFFINLPLALVVVLISLRHVAENSDRETTRVDWLGAILAALGLGALIYGLIESSQVGFSDRSVIMALAAGVVVLVLLFALPAAGDWWQLLDKFLSAGGCLGIRHGHYRGAAHHDCDEFDRAKPRWDRIGSEQRRRAHGKPDRNRSPWSRNAARVRNRSGSQIEHCEFAGVSHAIAANSIDKTRGHRHS